MAERIVAATLMTEREERYEEQVLALAQRVRALEYELRSTQNRLKMLQQVDSIAAVCQWEHVVTSGRFQINGALSGGDTAALGALTDFSELAGAMPVADRELFNGCYARALTDGKPFEMEHGLRLADGAAHIVRHVCMPFLGTDGTPLRVMGLMLDITEQRESERLVRQAHAEEQQARAEAEQAREQLQQEIERRARLMATVGHELRTPAASMQMMLSSDESLDRLELAQLRELSEHQLLLIDELRRIGNPQSAVRGEAVAMTPTQLFAAVRNQSAAMVSASGLMLDMSVSESANQPLLVDRYRMTTVVSNLLRNACVHSGGRCVWLSADVQMKLAGSGGLELVIQVEDDGAGIPPESRERVFEEFARLDQGRVGMGLGLAVVRGWLAELGGSVAYFESAHGGAGFEVRLPAIAVSEASPERAASPAAEAASPVAGCRVMLVEDDPLISKLTRRLLEKSGASVVCAVNGIEALTRLDEQPLDLIITDYFMPVMDGVELIRELRERGSTIPIVAATAATIGHETQELKDAGADEVFTKPLAAADVEGFVRRHT